MFRNVFNSKIIQNCSETCLILKLYRNETTENLGVWVEKGKEIVLYIVFFREKYILR